MFNIYNTESMNRRNCIYLVLAFAALTGCAAPQHKPAEPSVDPAMVRLAEAATDISRQMEQLAKVESARGDAKFQAKSYEYRTEHMPLIWQRKVALVEDYYGPVEDFMRFVSAMLEIQEPRVVGRRPGNPIMVAVQKGERSAIDFIADAGFQAGDRVLVKPVMDDQLILVQYR